MYFKRHAEKIIEKLSGMFGAVLVTGPRQVGKTTIMRRITDGTASYVSLDDPLRLADAREQGGTFLKDNPPPVFIDEIQKAPSLFPHIKMVLDEHGKKGQFFLCGSQQFSKMKNMTESLAGRLGILNLSGLSLRELCGCAYKEPFLPTGNYLEEKKEDLPVLSCQAVWEMIHRGSMPELCADPGLDWQSFYGEYVLAYIERDVREVIQIGDVVKFTNFMAVLAGRTGQLLNLKSVAADVGISQPTADRWLSVLTASNIVYLLRPYSSNLTKRAVKTPKLYFLDTGLAAYLTKWNSPEVLKEGAMSGAFFETFVIGEVLKGYWNYGILDPPVYFYRDKEQRKIDLIIEDGNTVYPLEIKKHADPSVKDISSFDVLDKVTGGKRGPGGVICLYDSLVTLKEKDRVIPVSYL